MYRTRMTHRARGLFTAASAAECVAYGVKDIDEGARRLISPIRVTHASISISSAVTLWRRWRRLSWRNCSHADCLLDTSVGSSSATAHGLASK